MNRNTNKDANLHGLLAYRTFELETLYVKNTFISGCAQHSFSTSKSTGTFPRLCRSTICAPALSHFASQPCCSVKPIRFTQFKSISLTVSSVGSVSIQEQGTNHGS